MSDSSAYKGFNYPLKGIVTSLEDPCSLNRIQVYIPNYHGKRDPSREGPNGSYPWAQVNSLVQQSEESGSDTTETAPEESNRKGVMGWISGVIQKITYTNNDTGQKLDVIAPPQLNDVVWLIFEGGDIRCPVYFGTAAVPKNSKESFVSNTEAVGSGGYSFQGSDGSYGYTYQFAGGSPVDMISEILYGTKDYGKIFHGTPSVSMSLGYVEAQANNGDAGNLLRSIYNKNPDAYRQSCIKDYGNFIDPNKNWRNQTFPASGNKLTNTIRNLLTSTAGKSAQDEFAYEHIGECFTAARQCGITDPTAITMFCHMYHVVGSRATSVVTGLYDKSLDSIYEASKQLSGYNGESTYTKIVELINQGMFVKTTTPKLNGEDVGMYLAWPLPSSTYITTHFSEKNKGINIRANLNDEVVAAHNGTVTRVNSNPNGNQRDGLFVVIQSDNTTTVYKHLNSVNVSVGQEVRKGDRIGTAGMTGDATGYVLGFEIYIDGIAYDPQRMTYGESPTSSTSSGSGSGYGTTGGALYGEDQIWNEIRKYYKNKYAIAGIMGNMVAESSLRSNNVQDTSGWDDNEYTNAVDSGTYDNFVNDHIGYGLCQWTEPPERKQGLLNLCRNRNVSISNAEAQIRYLYMEITNKMPELDAILRDATSIAEASDAFLSIFEQPYEYWKQYSYRQGLCYDILNRHS